MIRTVIVGGGMVGLTLARLLRARGHDPVVLERAPAGVYGARGFMLGYQGYDAFQELGVLERLSAAGRDVGVGPNGVPIGIAVDYGIVMATLAEDVPVAHGESVVELIRDGDRVAGVVSRGPGRAARGSRRTWWSPATGARPRCATWPGIEAEVSPAQRRLPHLPQPGGARAALRLPLHVRRRDDHDARLAGGLHRLAAHRQGRRGGRQGAGPRPLPAHLRRAPARGPGDPRRA